MRRSSECEDKTNLGSTSTVSYLTMNKEQRGLHDNYEEQPGYDLPGR
jgi:hypothetical protein